MIDYTASKGAIVSFTRSLSLSLADHGIRVNAVVPGPTWTPLIPSAFTAEEVRTFGTEENWEFSVNGLNKRRYASDTDRAKHNGT